MKNYFRVSCDGEGGGNEKRLRSTAVREEHRLILLEFRGLY
jgi:hypothetical protein